MSKNPAIKFTKEGLPIISIGKFFDGNETEKKNVVQGIIDACTTVGCFFVADHGVDWKLVDKCFKDMNTFFHLPLTEKMDYKSNIKNRGYAPFESQNVNAYMGRFGLPNDPLEKYAFGPVKSCPLSGDDAIKYEHMWAPTVYPSNPSTLEDSVKMYYKSVTNVSEKLMQIFSSALHLPDNSVYNWCNEKSHWLKVNFYPSLDKSKANKERFAEHTDSTPFTVLWTDQSKNNLMVRNVNGEWIYANAPPETFFVNLGEIMAIWTNDKWVATPHKVVCPGEEDMSDRIAFVFFIQVNHDTVISCIPSCLGENETAKYNPISFEEYMLSKVKRLANAGIY